jgi:WhiB family redox-sensing transcriptional regulator
LTVEEFVREFDPMPWKAYAACRDLDPSIFFPGRGEPTKHAKAICAGCPVRKACLNYALENGEKYGVWGGVAEAERRRMRRQRRVELREFYTERIA